jgi:membrane associated rhomboid family serine protease/Zn-finger nucleic acid-binding protein
MFNCPRCKEHLVREDSKRGVQWRCSRCEGRAITLGVLRRIVRKESVDALWQAARTNRKSASLPCPLCRNAMSPVQQFDALELDVCTTCHSAWFDPSELERSESTAPLPPQPMEPELPQKAREILAMAEVQSMRDKAAFDESMSPLPPDEAWKTVLTVFGIPVEAETPPLKRWPWVTWLVLTLMTIGTVWSVEQDAYKDWGFLPSDPLREHGLTFITSFFLHAGWLHLLGNAAFLFVFGDNVEDFLGHWRYALLLVLGSVSGDLLHLAFDPRGGLPLVGASAGISAVIVFYALAFPKARLIYFLRLGLYFQWVRFPAWGGLLVWLVLQAYTVLRQISGESNVSALAHFGGVGIGVLAWFVTRKWRTGEDREESSA